MTRPFAARYAGTCAECGGPIRPGDEVVYDEDDDLVHTEHRPSRPAVVCDRCWLTKPCECDE